MIRRAVIVGSSVSGVSCAKALRKEGFDGAIQLVSAEAVRPYDRPPLSKAWLVGEKSTADIALLKEDDQVELMLGRRASRIEAEAVELEDGERLAFDRLYLATGCRLRWLPVPGTELPGITGLRTLEDAECLRDALHQAERVAIIGAGFIGSEVASAARALGKQVTLFETRRRPFEHLLGGAVATYIHDLYRTAGVDLVLGQKVKRFVGKGVVTGVETEDGQTTSCDVAVIAVGVTPNLPEIAVRGIQVEDGVVVDDRLATGDPRIFAGGDVARWPYRGEQVRIEHWDVAHNMGAHAAKTMLGAQDAYVKTPYFWSDQFGLTFNYFGYAATWDNEVVRGDLDAGTFTVFYRQNGRIKAAFTVGRPREGLATRRLVDAGSDADPKELQDEDVSLKALSRRT